MTITEPSAAISQSYNNLTFDDEFNSYSTIDTTNSQAAGFNWYVQNWFSTSSTNSNNITISNGVLELGGGTGFAGIVSAFSNSSAGVTGTTIGNGAYMEARIQVNPVGPSGVTWPAFWGMAIQHITGNAQWTGQASGYQHFAEVDIMEHMSGLPSSQYVGAMHDWSGTYSTTSGYQYNIANYGNAFINVGSVDWTAFHTYGLLWVPQSGTTPGHATWYFDGQAVSSIYWLGPPTSTSLSGLSSGSFTPSSSGQATSTYSILDGQQLALNLQTDSSWPMYVDYVRVWQAGAAPAAVTVAVPVIASFSIDSATRGDGITNDNTLALTGTATANSTVLVYDGTTWLGTAGANASGAWTFTTGVLANGTHNFTATDVDGSGNTSAASTVLNVTVDTVAPNAPVMLSDSALRKNQVKLTGIAEANSTVTVFDGTTRLGTTRAGSNGGWTYTTGSLSRGAHTFEATATDAAGNISALSRGIDPVIGGFRSSAFNNDGTSGVLWRSASGGLAQWSMNGGAVNGSYVTSNGVAVVPDASWTVAGISDFDGDGRADILWRNSNGTLADWTMQGSTVASSAFVMSGGAIAAPDSSWSVAGVADFNGDGMSDILWRRTSGELAVWSMNGSAIESSAYVTLDGSALRPDASWSVAGIGDFDGDGNADVLWRNASGEVALWTMNGSVINSSADLSLNGATVRPEASWSVAGIGDFDADGRADILWRNGDGSVAMWSMNGSAINSSTAVTLDGARVAPDASWHVIEIGDFNGDGNSDILWRNDSGAMAEWLMNANTISQSVTPTSNGASASPDATWNPQAKPTVFA